MQENRLKGLFYCTLSIISWGLLPVSAKGLTEFMDPYTINFFRFALAIVPLGLYLLTKRREVVHGRLGIRGMLLLVVAVVALLLNHIYFMVALPYIPASSSQVVIQIGPLLLLMGGLVLFKESFTRLQWAGVGLLAIGFTLFFNFRLFEIIDPANDYGRGIRIMALAAIVWAFYGLAQKVLVSLISPAVVMMCCYFGGVIILFPFADKSAFLSLGVVQMALLLVCTFSSLIAYIAFAESLNYWPTSNSSALLALIPLITIGFERIFTVIFPEFMEFSAISFLSLAGALLVVVATMMITICVGTSPKTSP
tara:strand:+ start:29202 stop:30128 length:927 start_codon:yes stop_codon:yes gene_type:complete